MTAIKESDDVTAIKALIQAFFDRINAADPKGLQALFMPQANLTILRQEPARDPPRDDGSRTFTASLISKDEEKLAVVMRVSIETFVKAIEEGEKKRKGKPGPKIHEEPDLDETEVELDGGLFGAAWSPFRVYFDGKLHHYGKFVYTFAKRARGEEWKVVDLTQKYRRTESAEERPWDLGMSGNVLF